MRRLLAGEKEFERYLENLEDRMTLEDGPLERGIRSILEEVRRQGDRALLHYTQVYDRIRLRADQLLLGPDAVREAYRQIPKDFLHTLRKAARRIRRFHSLSGRDLSEEWIERGILLKKVVLPLERIGIYVPGGKASYPSTVLMAAVPAKAAGVREIVMVTPPRKGGIPPSLLVAADLAGVDRIFQVGGVQAIGALAYGTETLPRVDKIVGPGNRYVATAKRLVFGTVDIDMVAGPSEIVIVSDDKTPPSYLAADLISQAEHDERALSILITPFQGLGEAVRREIKRQLSLLKRRRIARESLDQRGAILIVKSLVQAMEIVNRIAPEHLELAVSKPLSLVEHVKHAGAVFLGPHTPEAIGDYLAGPNHILPTGGTARYASPLGVEDFMKRSHFIRFSKKALRSYEKDVRRFTEWEGLGGHYQAVRVRIR